MANSPGLKSINKIYSEVLFTHKKHINLCYNMDEPSKPAKWTYVDIKVHTYHKSPFIFRVRKDKSIETEDRSTVARDWRQKWGVMGMGISFCSDKILWELHIDNDYKMWVHEKPQNCIL